MRLFLLLLLAGLLSVFGQENPSYVIKHTNSSYFMVYNDVRNNVFYVNDISMNGDEFIEQFGTNPIIVDPVHNDNRVFNFHAWNETGAIEITGRRDYERTDYGIYQGIGKGDRFWFNDYTGQQVFENGRYIERRSAETAGVYRLVDGRHYIAIQNHLSEGLGIFHFDALTGIPLNVTNLVKLDPNKKALRLPNRDDVMQLTDATELVLLNNRSRAIYDGYILNRNGKIIEDGSLDQGYGYQPGTADEPSQGASQGAEPVIINNIAVYRNSTHHSFVYRTDNSTINILNETADGFSVVTRYPIGYNNFNESEHISRYYTNNVTFAYPDNSNHTFYNNQTFFYFEGQEVSRDGLVYTDYYTPSGVLHYIQYYWNAVIEAIIKALTNVFTRGRSIPSQFIRNIQQLERGANPVETIEEINLLLTPRQTRQFRRNVNRNLRLLETNNITALQTIIDTINGAFEPVENLVVPGVLMAVMYTKGKQSK